MATEPLDRAEPAPPLSTSILSKFKSLLSRAAAASPSTKRRDGSRDRASRSQPLESIDPHENPLAWMLALHSHHAAEWRSAPQRLALKRMVDELAEQNREVGITRAICLGLGRFWFPSKKEEEEGEGVDGHEREGGQDGEDGDDVGGRDKDIRERGEGDQGGQEEGGGEGGDDDGVAGKKEHGERGIFSNMFGAGTSAAAEQEGKKSWDDSEQVEKIVRVWQGEIREEEWTRAELRRMWFLQLEAFLDLVDVVATNQSPPKSKKPIDILFQDPVFGTLEEEYLQEVLRHKVVNQPAAETLISKKHDGRNGCLVFAPFVPLQVGADLLFEMKEKGTGPAVWVGGRLDVREGETEGRRDFSEDFVRNHTTIPEGEIHAYLRRAERFALSHECVEMAPLDKIICGYVMWRKKEWNPKTLVQRVVARIKALLGFGGA